MKYNNITEEHPSTGHEHPEREREREREREKMHSSNFPLTSALDIDG
jgi:hypothetical protein